MSSDRNGNSTHRNNSDTAPCVAAVWLLLSNAAVQFCIHGFTHLFLAHHFLAVKIKKMYTMKTYGGSGGIAPSFFISAREGGEWSVSCPGRFNPGERVPDIDLGPRTCLNDAERVKSCPYRD
jgi:hypothetical protein